MIINQFSRWLFDHGNTSLVEHDPSNLGIRIGKMEFGMEDRFTNSFSYETWHQKYKFTSDNSIEDTWRRVAQDLASVEKNQEEWTEKFYKTLEDFKFVPGGRITSNAGTGLTGTT